MQLRKLCFTLWVVVLCSACGVRLKKGFPSVVLPSPIEQFVRQRPPVAPWKLSQTLSIPNSLSASLQTVVLPGQGICISVRTFVVYEVARLYFLPQEVWLFDKYNKGYYQASYAEVNSLLVHRIPWALSYSLLEALLLGYFPEEANIEKVFPDMQIEALIPMAQSPLHYTIAPDTVNLQVTLPSGAHWGIRYTHYSSIEEGHLPRWVQMRWGSSQSATIETHRILSSQDVMQQLTPKVPQHYTRLYSHDLLNLLQSL